MSKKLPGDALAAGLQSMLLVRSLQKYVVMGDQINWSGGRMETETGLITLAQQEVK